MCPSHGGNLPLLPRRLRQGREHVECALGVIDASQQGELLAEFGVAHGATCLCYHACVLNIQGYAEQGMQALARARSLGSMLPPASMRVPLHLFIAVATASAGDVAGVRTEAQSLADLAARYRLPRYGLYADAFLGWAAVATERPQEEAVRALERSVNELTARETRFLNSLLLARLATALADCGRPDEARWTTERALAECEQTAQRWYEAEVWRVHGEVLLKDVPPDRAEAARCIEKALSIARSQGARLWELRAVVSLARLRADQGDNTQALELLASTYGWFTEGFDTPDLVEARTLLGELERGTRLPSS